jgi:DNA-binding transcriptional ArsR family regulator
MVEYTPAPLDLIFQSLADATRRDILRRLSRAEQTISELARPYAMSLAAIAKHVGVLERAGLVTKERTGKEKVVRVVPATLKAAEEHLSEYEKLWAARFDALEALLSSDTAAPPVEKFGPKERTTSNVNPNNESNKKWPRSKSRSPKTRRT